MYIILLSHLYMRINECNALWPMRSITQIESCILLYIRKLPGRTVIHVHDYLTLASAISLVWGFAPIIGFS